MAEGHGEIAMDFTGVDGLTPSFLDETLTVIEECLDGTSDKQLLVKVMNPPTQLSSKFAAVARGHDLLIKESDSGAWIISRGAEA